MKKVLVLAVISLLMVSVFVACGTKEEMKDDLTTMMNDLTSALDDMTDDGRGEVTVDETTDELTTEELTEETTYETTAVLEEDVTDKASTARSILEDITE